MLNLAVGTFIFSHSHHVQISSWAVWLSFTLYCTIDSPIYPVSCFLELQSSYCHAIVLKMPKASIAVSNHALAVLPTYYTSNHVLVPLQVWHSMMYVSLSTSSMRRPTRKYWKEWKHQTLALEHDLMLYTFYSHFILFLVIVFCECHCSIGVWGCSKFKCEDKEENLHTCFSIFIITYQTDAWFPFPVLNPKRSHMSMHTLHNYVGWVCLCASTYWSDCLSVSEMVLRT